MKRMRLFLIYFLLIIAVVTLQSQTKDEYVVVLDAGHGGKDPGNLGGGYKEKEIVLKVVKHIARELRNLKDIKVVLTRDDDFFVELHNRAKIANDKKADLFVSVHCDAFHKTSPHGAGTFVLGLSGNKENLEIAKRENGVILLEDNYEQNYDYDPNSPESVIGLSMLQEENLDESLAIASLIQNSFVEIKRYDRSVKQNNFLVLRETVMPSVLIELGFLTNKAEGVFLNSKKGQVKMAKSIVKAIEKYINNLKVNSLIRNDGFSSKDEEIKVVKKPGKIIKKEKKEEVRVITQKKETKKLVVNSIQYKVQIAASKKYISPESYNFKGLQNVEMKTIGDYYKYYYGSTTVFNDIKPFLKEAKESGHKESFVVAFEGDKKISIREALKKQ